MVIKRGNRLYSVGENFVISKSREDSASQRVSLRGIGIDREILYEGDNYNEVFDAIGAELGKNKNRIVIDLDAIIDGIEPSIVEEPVEEPAEEESAE